MIVKYTPLTSTGVPQHEPNAVVIGLAPDKMTYQNMNISMR